MKQLMTVKTGLYDDIHNVIPLPDTWNGERWALYREKGSDDEKAVNEIYYSYIESNILCAFKSMLIPKTFFAELDGVMTEYKKGMRILLDQNRRYKGALIAIKKGHEIITPEGEKYKLPITDLTDAIQDAMGEITDFGDEGKEKIFIALQILNTLQKEFTDEEIIIGGAECANDPKRKKTFVYVKEKLQIYRPELTTKLILNCILGRSKLDITEKKTVEIDFDITNKPIVEILLKAIYRIKKEMGGLIPSPFLHAFVDLVKKWRKNGYFLSQTWEQEINVNNRGKITTKNVIKANTVRENCFTLSDPTDTGLFKEYIESIVNYITGTWKVELKDNNEKRSGNYGEEKREIESKVKDMWEEHKTK